MGGVRQGAQASGEMSGTLFKACMLALEVATGGSLAAFAAVEQVAL